MGKGRKRKKAPEVKPPAGEAGTSELLKSIVNKSSEKKQALIFTYLFVLTYILIVVAATDYVSLLKPDGRIILPILRVHVPVMSIFIFAPFLILVIHFNSLFHIVEHSRKLHRLDKEAGRVDRSLLDPHVFNYLFGSGDLRESLLQFVLWFLYWFGPLFVLLSIQLRLSSYRNVYLTFMHLVVFLVDLVFMVLAWRLITNPGIEQTERREAPTKLRQLFTHLGGRAIFRWKGWSSLATRIISGIMLFIAIGNMGGLIASKAMNWSQANPELDQSGLGRLERVTEFDSWFAGILRMAVPPLKVNGLNLRSKSDPNNEGNEKIRMKRKDLGIRLVERDLSFGDFSESVLNKAHLAKAVLVGANLRKTNLRYADLNHADLRGANLFGADLQGANLRFADLRQADLRNSDLRQADLSNTLLARADLSGAKLQGAELYKANLYMANFINAQMQGVDLAGVKMNCAVLTRAKLQGANLSGAQIRYSNLEFARLWGADMQEVDLSNSSLRYAGLEGVDMSYSKLENTDIRHACLQGIVSIRNVSTVGLRSYHYDDISRTDWDRVRIYHGKKIPDGATRRLFNRRMELAKERARVYRQCQKKDGNCLPFPEPEKYRDDNFNIERRLNCPEIFSRSADLRVLTKRGPSIIEPTRRRAREYSKITHTEIKVDSVLRKKIYEFVLKDLKRKRSKYDVYIIPANLSADFVEEGFVAELGGNINKDPNLNWSDIMPFYRQSGIHEEDKVYRIPLDGNMIMAYFRKDIIKPQNQSLETLRQYEKLARRWNGKDLNGDRIPDFGSCLPASRNDFLWAIVGPHIQSQGTDQGIFFNVHTMEPIFKTEGFQAALKIYKEIVRYGPRNKSGKIRTDLTTHESRRLFTAGRCALSIDYGDTGTLLNFKKTVHDQVATVVFPGSERVWNRKTRSSERCDLQKCPHSWRGINHAPFVGHAGWVGIINKKSRNHKRAYGFLSYMSQKKQSNMDTTLPDSGMGPYRISQLQDTRPWEKRGMHPGTVKNYLQNIHKSLESPNVILGLSVKKADCYKNHTHSYIILPYLRSEKSLSQAILELDEAWRRMTYQSLETMQTQCRLYCESLNLKSCPCKQIKGIKTFQAKTKSPSVTKFLSKHKCYLE